MKAQNTELSMNFEGYQIVLRQIVHLFLVGVILPLPFLYSWPVSWWYSIIDNLMPLSSLFSWVLSWMPSAVDWLITFVEMAFTVVVGYLAIGLFRSVQTLMTLSNRIG